MADDTPKKGKVKVLKEYFGLKEGQKLTDFAAELKELTDEEKVQLTEGIEDGSLTY